MLSELRVLVSPFAEACTDSSAAKSFVAKRGLGRMRHLEELWLQHEVGAGKVVVVKVPGEQNPADAVTKFLSREELVERLQRLSLRLTWDPGEDLSVR